MDEFKKLFATAEPPDLGPGPREGVMGERESNAALDRALPDANNEAGQLLRALVLLWHDHLDAAHLIAQGIENADGAFVHGIVHRREPDYGNATYWFRRVGRHPAFPEIARRVGRLLAGKEGAGLLAQLVRKGEWDAYGFIAACEEAAQRPPTDAGRLLLREVQRVETEVLAEALWKKTREKTDEE